MKYKILAKDGRAKRADVETVHGTIHTPVFMNVGTVAAIKGAVSTDDLRGIGTQVELSNTYHLHVRTGDKPVSYTHLPGCCLYRNHRSGRWSDFDPGISCLLYTSNAVVWPARINIGYI